ncbi:FAD synthetase, putative [Perkinsus marinus ATCC 50983]|uniref:FAD synthase n=1 Tax=Perkinsus marinus (strain ATCC 50983 / TXsc) TaxID=423536 RepID=C5K7J4_PERM5|nr:FAD synthetase, putative [Perkinsus marinus ATCC 50983]EER19529.1 FAD synthetase, putative [Perkinsus marinus ATCC 50983]|eukprot:XP_002787733.1 FAD synthetase, putative [Perkinsus marinus ATCC 50983]
MPVATAATASQGEEDLNRFQSTTVADKDCLPSGMDGHAESDEALRRNSTTASVSSGAGSMSSMEDGRSLSPIDEPTAVATSLLANVKEINRVRQQTAKSLSIIAEAYDNYKPEELCLAFNGGKDCTVLLHMVDHVFRQKHSEGVPLRTLYIADPKNDTFEEVESFIEDMQKVYNLDIMRVVGGVKVGLERIKEEHPELKAIFMGSRSTDPFCGDLTAFAKTTEGWPEFMRVNPILDWTYSDVWNYLELYGVKYCKLYGHGYTSIGRKSDTIPNPDLAMRDGDGRVYYKHARELEDESRERCGRYVKQR